MTDEVEKLAQYIMDNIEGEPSRNEGACECAIRIIKEQEKEIEILWGILDDIDTLGDMLKPEQNTFFKAVMNHVAKRFEIRGSDGYKLYRLQR